MSGLDIFALIILATIVLTVVVALVILGGLPGKVARDRKHAQADAIAVAGWLGILTLGVLWPLALIWAYTRVGVDEQEVQS
jgi:hypothetical protein